MHPLNYTAQEGQPVTAQNPCVSSAGLRRTPSSLYYGKNTCQIAAGPFLKLPVQGIAEMVRLRKRYMGRRRGKQKVLDSIQSPPERERLPQV